LHNLCASTA